jgi:hypothetical protein
MNSADSSDDANFDAYGFFLQALINALHICDEGPTRAILYEALRCADAGRDEVVSCRIDRRGALLRLSAEHLDRAEPAPGDGRGARALYTAHRAAIAALFEHEARRATADPSNISTRSSRSA